MPKVIDVLKEIDRKIEDHIENYKKMRRTWNTLANTAIENNNVDEAKDRLDFAKGDTFIIRRRKSWWLKFFSDAESTIKAARLRDDKSS